MAFWHVIASLDAKTASCASRALKKAELGKKFTTLKSFLMVAFSPNKWQRTQRILSLHELGDHQASQLMDYLLHNMGDHDPAILLQFVLLRCLPAHVQSALASSDATDMEQRDLGLSTCLHPRCLLSPAPASLVLTSSVLPAAALPMDPCNDPCELHQVGRCTQPADRPSGCLPDGLFWILGEAVQTPMLMAPGKQADASAASLSAVGGSHSLVEVVDRHSDQVFLLDSSTEV